MIKIMLDPGHAGDYFNASPVVAGYYESSMAWNLTYKLKAELEKYGFKVGVTRTDKNADPDLVTRGMAAKGYDLFLSLHSNAAANETPDAPWIIHFLPDGKTNLDEKSKAIAQVLGPVISETMGVSAPYYYTKGCGNYDRDGNGQYDDEYYGVLFGAKAVGVPGVILEHSFHTNKKATEWLMKDSNLQKLAEEEAKAIAEYYGIKEEDLPMTAAEKKAFAALEESVTALQSEVKKLKKKNTALEKKCVASENKITSLDESLASSKKTISSLKKELASSEDKVAELDAEIAKYNKYSVFNNAAIKWNFIDKNLPSWAKPTIKKLVDKKYLSGNAKGELELSYLMMRILVILDRVGMFK